MFGAGNEINKQAEFEDFSRPAHASHFGNMDGTVIATLGPISPLIDCLIAQNLLTVPQWPSGVAVGTVGFVSTLPHAVSFIPSFCYSSTEREAWDWIYSVMKWSTLFFNGERGG